MMEIRAKCRRLKQRQGLKLVIIDYLQLMSSPKRVENRQQEVSEMSRSLKLLAKEIDVPVIALSQLNRGPEQRNDKKPLLSDLRESGCLTADTRILRADTGAEVTLGELVASGARDVAVWSLDERLRLIPRTMTHAFPSGVKEVFRVRLRSGREVQATANHPFLTYDGWQLARGSRAWGRGSPSPGTTPGPATDRPLPEHGDHHARPPAWRRVVRSSISRSGTPALTRRTSPPSRAQPGTLALPPCGMSTLRPAVLRCACPHHGI